MRLLPPWLDAMAATLTTLALLYLAALIIPGPNLLLLTHTAASASRRTALGVALGISTGTVLWVAVAVFGVQQIFDAAPRAANGATCHRRRVSALSGLGTVQRAASP